MDRNGHTSAVSCKFCGEAFTLNEDEVDGNLPRVLLCGHIYCTSCLRSIECSSVIKCPECEVESSLPEGGVCGLQEDSRIIGLIYTAKMNKMKSLHCDRSKNHRRDKLLSSTDANTEDMEQPVDAKKIENVVDEALARAAENLAQLEHMLETQTTGLAEQVKRENAQLVMEIKQAADKAVHAIQKWKDVQLKKFTKMEGKFSASQSEVCHIQERIKALENAMQIAKEVRRVPFLEQYCTLDEVLETLQAPVDNQSFDTECITLDSGLRCVFQSESLNQSLALSLKMEVSKPKHFSESLPKGHQPDMSKRNSCWQRGEGRNSSCIPLGHNRPRTWQKQYQESLGTNSPSLRESSPRPRQRSNLSHHSSASDLGTPDVIIEELLYEGQDHALPPTGPELANDKWRIHRRGKKTLSGSTRNVTSWVVVTHIVNPGHFYVRYVAEKRESEALSKKIYNFCCTHNCCFSSSDRVETGSTVFVKWKDGLWCRASVVEVFQNDCGEAVKACPVTELASVQVFFIDYGLTKNITIESFFSEDRTTESKLKAVNNHLKKVDQAVNVELGNFVPQAIRCSLKGLVPYDLINWSKEAQVEFQRVVDSAAVEMRPLGQDIDTLLVDLRKAPMDQSSDVPISVREYLVFIEVARFYSPVTLGRRPLLYYPPSFPKINTELNAVVSHINNPADFHIQLVDIMESVLLSAKLQDCYNATVAGEDGLSIYCPVIGQACVARYSDNLWYRALVIGHPGGRKVEVLYVDFGNKKILSVGDLRKIKDEFFALPSMAIHCCLSDVFPLDGETWSDACTNRFISLAHQKLVTIVATGRVPKTEPLPVKLFESSLNGPGANIAEQLVTEELACFKEGLKSKDPKPPADDFVVWDPPLELGSATEDLDATDQNVTGEQDEEPLDFQHQLNISAELKDLKVKVSHVNSPSSFYVQFTQYDSQLKRMCELVKERALMEPQDVEWKAAMYCAAHINGIWERGQICSDVTSSNIAEVMRCDHGSKVKLHVSNLRPLPSSLMGSLALECTLTDIRPAGGRSTWTATACDFLSYYLTGVSAVMTIKELEDKRPVPVTLFCANRKGQLVNIADFLASEGLALKERKPMEAIIQKSKTDAKSPVGETPADSSDGEKENTPPAPSFIPFPSTSSQSKETDAKSPVGETPADGSDGEKENTPPAPSFIPFPSTSSQSKETDAKSPEGDTQADSSDGEKENTPPAPSFIPFPSTSSQSKETDAKSPVGDTQADGSDGKKENTPTPPAPSFIPFPSPSSLVSTSPLPKPYPRTIMSAEKVKTHFYLPPELPCLGNIQMTISAVGEDGVIYARPQNAECQLKQLMERSQQCLKTLPKQKLYTWKSVQGCAIIGSDMLWYRGQLLEFLGGHVKVQYVDYGLVENIPVIHIYPMLLCDDVPQLCLPCQLHDIKPVGGRWQPDAVALIREMLLNRSVEMQVMGLPTDPRGLLTVELFLDGMNLSRILCHHEHASMDQTASEQKGHSVLSVGPFLDNWDINTEGLRGPEEPVLGPFIYPNLPQEGEQFQVRVKHLWTPNELSLWPLDWTAEVDGETLDEAITRINANIDSLPHLTNFPNGGPCLAEYSNGKYYRATLVDFTSVEPIMMLVKHVDFGSDDTLPTSKLRQMPAELLRFPSQALKVHVAGFKAPSVNREKDMLSYSPKWSVKATMDMVELLHSNLTASVVAQKPDLTVLLYGGDGELVHLPLVSSGEAELE